ncbi:hypothetical protein ACA910_010671 [Epithemia clementina (nom. ined.)]
MMLGGQHSQPYELVPGPLVRVTPSSYHRAAPCFQDYGRFVSTRPIYVAAIAPVPSSLVASEHQKMLWPASLEAKLTRSLTASYAPCVERLCGRPTKPSHVSFLPNIVLRQQEQMKFFIPKTQTSQVVSGLDLLRDVSVVAAKLSTPTEPSKGSPAASTKSDDNVFTNISNNKKYADERSSSSNSSKDKIYIETVGDLDVLCGRGGRSNHHPGNKRYRQVVAEMKLSYRHAEAKTIKTDVSRAIVDHVYGYGGRFIKKDEETGKYFVLSQTEARKKTSQALRETKQLKWTI